MLLRIEPKDQDWERRPWGSQNINSISLMDATSIRGRSCQLGESRLTSKPSGLMQDPSANVLALKGVGPVYDCAEPPLMETIAQFMYSVNVNECEI